MSETEIPSYPDSTKIQTICLFHNDADGRASAAIVRQALGSETQLYEMNYGDQIPWQLIEKAGRVVVVDFSLPKPDMEAIAQDRQLIWIDHHKTALDQLPGLAQTLPGVRDTSESACVLTWNFFFPEKAVPKAVKLIGDRDIWRWSYPDTGPFGEGLFQQNTYPDNDQLWKPLLDDDSQILKHLIEEGEVLVEARWNSIRRMVSHYGFEVKFEGYRTLAINNRGSGEMGQFIRELGFQIAYCYVDLQQNGDLMTLVTLYSDGVDVSEIAEKFGGGGHPGAAGFSFKRNMAPFPPDAKVEW
jgi:oligoribonuclease NrnB/cAMP/cGMP phosphodiesterase (DHH superfamily)